MSRNLNDQITERMRDDAAEDERTLLDRIAETERLLARLRRELEDGRRLGKGSLIENPAVPEVPWLAPDALSVQGHELESGEPDILVM